MWYHIVVKGKLQVKKCNKPIVISYKEVDTMAKRHIKRPNGNGSIEKIKGRVRKPYGCRVTVSIETVP